MKHCETCIDNRVCDKCKRARNGIPNGLFCHRCDKELTGQSKKWCKALCANRDYFDRRRVNSTNR